MQRSSEANRGQLREAIQCNPSRSVALSRTQSHSVALSRTQSLTAPSACSKKMVCAIRRNASSSMAIHTSGVTSGSNVGEDEVELTSSALGRRAVVSMGSFDGTSAEQLRSAVMGTPSVTAAVEASGWTPSRVIPKVVEW
jgi:hypothetical protein